MKKLGRFNLISLLIAIGCAIGFYYAEDTDTLLGKEMFFTLGVTFAFFTIWR